MKSRIRHLQGRIIPDPIKVLVVRAFWWAFDSDDVWQGLWQQYLDTLDNGGSLDADPGPVGDKEYLTAKIVSRCGSFKGLKVLGTGYGTGRIEAWLGHEGADVVCLDLIAQGLKVSRLHAQRSKSDGH